MSLISVLKKSLGDKGLLQAAKRLDPNVQSPADITEDLARKIQASEPATVRRPGDVENPSDEKSADLFAKTLDTSPEPSIKDILKKAGGPAAAVGAGGAIYGLSKQADKAGAAPSKQTRVGPVRDDELEFGQVPGAPKSLRETLKDSSSPAPAPAPRGLSVPKVGQRPEDLSAGRFSHSDEDYIRKLESLKSRGEEAEGSYQDRVRRAEWGEVADRIAQAAAQYGAARQGLRDNVDLSGVKVQGADWKSKIDRYGQDLDRTGKALNQERELEKDAANTRRSDAEKQFSREEAVKEKNWRQRMDEWEKQQAAAQAAALKNQELALQESKAQQRRGEELEDFEKRKEIESKYRKSEEDREASKAAAAEKKAADKAEKDRRTALQGIAAAISSGIPEKKLKEKIASLGKSLDPAEVQAIMDEDGGWFGRAAPARQELIKKMLGGDPSSPEPEASSGEIIKLDPKSGRKVRYDAKTKKPLGWAD